MLCDIDKESLHQAHALVYDDKLKSDLETSLYLKYTSFALLSLVLGLVSLKATYGWAIYYNF